MFAWRFVSFHSNVANGSSLLLPTALAPRASLVRACDVKKTLDYTIRIYDPTDRVKW
jgi:hypothetical protein